MTNTCTADKPSTSVPKSAFTNPFSHGQKESPLTVVSWHAIHDDPESYWTQLLLASVSADYAARQSLWQDQEVTVKADDE